MNIDHLKDKFDLNELEVSLLEYIKKNQKQLKNITIRQMAKDNFTSTSAIYRLCNKLEFSGYSDMIYHLSHRLKETLESIGIKQSGYIFTKINNKIFKRKKISNRQVQSDNNAS